MDDPASLRVALSFSGMDHNEATVVFNNLPAGAAATVAVTAPPLGGKRFAISVDGLSVKGAKDLTTTLFLYVDGVLAGHEPEVAR